MLPGQLAADSVHRSPKMAVLKIILAFGVKKWFKVVESGMKFYMFV